MVPGPPDDKEGAKGLSPGPLPVPSLAAIGFGVGLAPGGHMLSMLREMPVGILAKAAAKAAAKPPLTSEVMFRDFGHEGHELAVGVKCPGGGILERQLSVLGPLPVVEGVDSPVCGV